MRARFTRLSVRVAAALAAALAACALGACANTVVEPVEQVHQQMPEVVDVPAEGVERADLGAPTIVVGDPNDPITIELVNNLGETITGLEVSNGEQGSDTAPLAIEGQWDDGVRAVVHYGVGQYVAEQSDFIVSCGSTTHELHALNLDFIEAADLKISDGVAYLDYTLADGATFNTLARERAKIDDPTGALANSIMPGADHYVATGEEAQYYDDYAANGYDSSSYGYDPTYYDGSSYGYDTSYYDGTYGTGGW